MKKHCFFAPNLVRAVSPQPLGVFDSNFKHRSVGVCSCAFFTFYSCHTYFRYFWVKKHCFLHQILFALFLRNRLEFSIQILNIGQLGCVVVPFSHFFNVTHILGIFGLKKNLIFAQILSALFLHNRLEFSFQILNIGQW